MSKKLNNDVRDNVTEKEIGTMTSTKLYVMFDVATENFNSNDSIGIENANYEMHRNWRNFLEAGFDATQVAKMMSPADVWEHYDELIAHGAQIDMAKLYSNFFEELFNEDFTREHWNELVSRGVSPDILADRCYNDCIYSIPSLERVLAKGVSLKKAFELASDWLEISEYLPEEQIKILTWFFNRGLPKNDIKEWLEHHVSSSMRDYIVESGSDFFEKFGIEDGDIIDRWLDSYGYMYFSEKKLSDLPDTISVDKLISFFSMKEIFSHCQPYGFDDFVSDYLEAGEDINTLAQKFMNEIGYSSDSSDSGALLDLVYAGASADIIDPAKYIEQVDVSKLDDCEAQNWYDYLESEGYSSQLINKFLR